MAGYTDAPVLTVAADRPGPLARAEVRHFDDEGYVVRPAVLSSGEATALAAEFMTLASAGPVPGHFEPSASPGDARADPLRAYPRVMQPHLVNPAALRHLLDVRITDVVAQLLGEEPLACQTMFYFKPPGARGQSLHQDNFYLKVEPGTCVAAWVALDHVDRDNGGLEVVPGTHRMEIFCPEEADPETSFTREHVPPPPGLEAIPVDLAPGDVLFFNGSLVHGSGPNRTTDRFRRSFICHYAPGSTERISDGYPTARLSGERVSLPPAEGGGPCGTEWDDTPRYH